MVVALKDCSLEWVSNLWNAKQEGNGPRDADHDVGPPRGPSAIGQRVADGLVPET